MYQAIVIDDERWVVKSLIATIRNQEYFEITSEFYDGLSGLEYLRINRPQLAFVDVRLPGMGGLEILQAAHEEGIPTLFIMISGHAEFAYAQKAMLHNAIGYCLKPFSRNELLDAMQKAWNLLEKQNPPAPEAIQPEDGTSRFVPRHLVSSHRAVQKMLDFTETHYQQDISIQDLSEHCSISPNYASQLFKQEMGITFVSYLTSLRIDHAIWLLSHTDLPVNMIASQVGYADYFYFAKVFKKVTGLTPTSYRCSSTP